MKRVFRGLLLAGVLVGAVAALRGLLGEKESAGEAQVTFEDGSTRTLSDSDIEGQEFVDLARKLIQSGL